MISNESVRTRRPRMSRADREQQMLDVAEEVFAERGYGAVSMEEIAERVGLSKPMLYEYFGSKEGLLLGVIRRARGELRETTEQAVGAAGSPEEVMRRGYIAYFRFNGAHRRAWLVLLQEPVLMRSAAEEIEAIRRQQSEMMVGLLAAHLPDRPRRALEAYAESMIGACERTALWLARNPEVTPEEAADHLMDLTWTGLASPAANS
ncbi:TetR/AcrR family transcriptional regulator [Actinoallomurus sp. NPDC050550]|uniref:TetR/AcrR family transcriptional regulator n=1 Tax=Actinoallomurus sp. NPDC050550 TaxID=3154937 RepID=UPI0033E0D686